MNPDSEHALYPKVARWLKLRQKCFATALDTGLKSGRVDVLGVRDIGGNLSGASEVIAVEVKRAKTPFATAAGQAHGYSVYADRCYLALPRTGVMPYTDEEVDIATRLGIGLLAIGGRTIRTVVTAPRGEPIGRMRLEILEKMHLASCTICGSLFRRGEPGRWSANVVRSGPSKGIPDALEADKGLVYWLQEADKRIRDHDSNYLYARRYVCKDCVRNLFWDLWHAIPDDE